MATTKTEETKAKRRPGFQDDGKTPYPGVDPESGERVTVTLQALRDEFGKAKGEEMYQQIGMVTGSVDFFGRTLEAHAPDLQIKGANKDVVEKVSEILAKE